MSKRLKDINSAENMFLLTLAIRIGPPVMVVLMGAEFLIFGPRFIWFVVPDVAATGLIILAARWGLDQFSRAAGSVLLPSGKGTPMARQYSEQDALVVRGHFVEAADSYRAIIEDDPANIDARLRLGRLLEKECNDPAGAEECYRRIRGLSPSPEHDWVVSNALIDLYHHTGQHQRLRDELGRMSRQYAGKPAGISARRRYDELGATNDERPIGP